MFLRLLTPYRLLFLSLCCFGITWLQLPVVRSLLFFSGVVFLLMGLVFFFVEGNFRADRIWFRQEMKLALWWLVVLLGVIVGLLATKQFSDEYGRVFWVRFFVEEGGFWETVQVFVFLLSAVLLFFGLIRYRRIFELRMEMILPILFGLFCFFIAVEEANWGQQWFGYEGSSWLSSHNEDREWNIHELRIGDFRIVLLVAFIVNFSVINYCGLVPLLCFFFEDFRDFVYRLHVPVPHIFWIPCMLIVGLVKYNWLHRKVFGSFARFWNWSYSEFLETFFGWMVLGAVVLLVYRWRYKLDRRLLEGCRE